MILHVQYRDEKYDYVDSSVIDALIRAKRIKQLYRPSERRWVDLDLGPARGVGGLIYLGPERRQFLSSQDAEIVYLA